MKTRSVHVLVLTSICLNCQRLTPLEPIPATATLPAISNPGVRIPQGRKTDFELALLATRQTLYSEEFRTALAAHIANLGTGPHTAAWEGMTADEIIRDMQERLPELSVTTFGGLRGRFNYWVFGTLAFDGGSTGPIRINRAPLGRRDVGKIIGTIAHELSHRAGMSHPSYGTDKNVGKKEPPYVIGEMLQKLAIERMKHLLSSN